MVHFRNDRSLFLSDIYPTIYVGLAEIALKRRLPAPGRFGYVHYFADFSNPSSLLSHLLHGYIVVSQNRSEPGVEFLVPFFDEQERLHVACAQCKFGKVSWGQIRANIQPVIESFKALDVAAFPLILTNADRTTMYSASYEGMIVLTAKELFDRTSGLGILRLHTEKLGKALSAEQPLLQAAAIS